MNDSGLASREMVVCLTISKQEPPKPAPWWQGLTPDQQDEALDRIDPQDYAPGRKPPMPIGRWNREKRRVRRLRQKWIDEIASLRRRCHCDNCVEHRRPPFPRYYVANGISYECWLEAHVVDEEMEELLTPLRNERQHVGSAVVGRKPVDHWNIPGQ